MNVATIENQGAAGRALSYAYDVMRKVDLYFAHGVKSCWVITPPAHALSIYVPDGPAIHCNNGAATDPVLGITADVDAVFS